MKKQRLVGLLLMAILILIQLCDCSTVLAVPPDEYVSTTIVDFQQANGGLGTFRILKKPNGQLVGAVEHSFRVLYEEVMIGKDKWGWVTIRGEILDGRAEGDRFSITVHYFPHKEPKFFNGGNYVYEGTMSPGGVVVGDQYNVFTPQSRVKWSTNQALRWIEIKKEAAPTPPTKSSGTAKPSNSGPGANPAPWVNLHGTWATTIGNGKTLIMELTQNGDWVEGKYDVVAAAPINGTMSGRISADGKLNFNWTQYGDMKGTGTGSWLLDRGSNTFQGAYVSQTPVAATGPWTGSRASGTFVKPPAAQVFPVLPPGIADLGQNQRFEQLKQLNRVYNGKWVVKEKSSGTEYTMTFAQNGNSVTGTFQPKNGKIEGTMADDGLLTYRWSDESGSSGAGIFAIYEGVQLVGTYSKSQNPWEVSGQWAGGRQ